MSHIHEVAEAERQRAIYEAERGTGYVTASPVVVGYVKPAPETDIEASARLGESERETIREVATAMGEDRALRATVIGRADTVGRDQPNLRLSRQRAMAVRDALAREGVDRGRIDTRWTGDRRPPAAQGPNTEEGGDRVVDIALQRRGQSD